MFCTANCLKYVTALSSEDIAHGCTDQRHTGLRIPHTNPSLVSVREL